MIRTILIFVLLLLYYQSMAVVFKMTNAVCQSKNETVIVFHYCRLRAVRRDVTYFTANATLKTKVNSMFVNAQVMKRANGYKPWLYNIYIDACKFTERQNNPIIKIIWGLFKDYSTLNHTCPYVGLQTVKDFELKSTNLPLSLPTGEYALFITWILYDRPQFITNVYFTFIEDLL